MTRPIAFRRTALACLALVAVSAGLPSCGRPPSQPRSHLLIVIDGLRPDYVTADVMPALTALGRRGVVFTNHHAVYPTVTRVNASSISTGSFPDTHGLLGNTVFFPSVDPTKFVDTSDRTALLAVASAEGRLLTAPTIAESLQAAGRRMLVVSSGSGGSALLNNHTVAGGAILHYDYTVPESLGADMAALGPAPPEDDPQSLDRRAVDAFLRVGIPRVSPAVTVMWLGALDAIAHDEGVGAPPTIEALRQVDGLIGRVEDGLRAAGVFDRYDIWVTSDHGFSTYTGGVDLAAALRPFAGTLPDGTPRIVTGSGAIYVRDGDASAITGIVAALQRMAGVGAIFTRAARPGSLDGSVAGTLSFDAVRWDHARSAQVLFSPDWTDDANDFGLPGTSASGGTAGHGSSSPWDVHSTLIAAGPGLKSGATLASPSANVDFAPTVLRMLGIPVPATMQGRLLIEALLGDPADEVIAVQGSRHTARAPDGTYEVTATYSTVSVTGRHYRYFDSAKATRP